MSYFDTYLQPTEAGMASVPGADAGTEQMHKMHETFFGVDAPAMWSKGWSVCPQERDGEARFPSRINGNPRLPPLWSCGATDMMDDLHPDDLEDLIAEHEEDLHRELDAGAERIIQHLLDGMSPCTPEQERVLRNLAASISEVHLELAQLQADYARVTELLADMHMPAGVTIH